jgi:hypothetical protein
MKKLKFKKIKFNINWKNFFNYILLILLTSLILLNFLIALPLTESIAEIRAFDLNVVNDYWSKEYVLELDSENSAEIRKTKNILFRRLNNYGVEEVSVYQENSQLRVVVKTSKDQTYVDELVRNPYQYSLVTRKEEVDFEREENTLAPYLVENYNETEFDASAFRNIYITELPNSSGDKSYFGIAKPWANRSGQLKDFLSEYMEQYIGVDIDGFVTPIYVNDPSQLAIVITAENEEGVEAINLLYNSGNIPVGYELTSQNELDVKKFDVNYIEITVAVFVSILAIYIYRYFTKIQSKKETIKTMFVTLLSLAMFLSVLKIINSPVHIFILLIDAVVIILFSNILYQNPESRYPLLISAFLIGLVFKYLGIGYLRIWGSDLLMISIVSFISILLVNLFINKLSFYFKK